MPTPRLNGTRVYATVGDLSDVIAANDLDAAESLRIRVARLQEPWMRSALCRVADVDMFDTSRTGQAAALAVCARCEALQPCRSWALSTEIPLDGCTIAGMTPAAYKVARPRRKSGRKPHAAS